MVTSNTNPAFPLISRTSLRNSTLSSSWLSTSLSCDIWCVFMWPPVGSTHLLRCTRRGETTSSHGSVRDAVYHIIYALRHHAHWERTCLLISSTPGGRGGCVDIVISKAAMGHTLVDIVVADLTRRDLAECATR